MTKRERASAGRPRKPSATLSLRGRGWWYDRQKRRYIEIYDHVIDAVARLDRFRLTDAMDDVSLRVAVYRVRQGVAGGGNDFEKARDVIIPWVCSKGFIRIRWVPRQGTLGWQFYGRSADAMIILLRFIKRHEIGPATVVTFTNFERNVGVNTSLNDLDPLRDFCRSYP